MAKQYQSIVVKIIAFDNQDVITTSGDGVDEGTGRVQDMFSSGNGF